MTSTLTRSDEPTFAPRIPDMKVTPTRVMASEWTKFRSLRSSLITLAVSVLLTVGVGVLISWVTEAAWKNDASHISTFNAVSTSLGGINISQLAVGVLGVLLISGEYSTGMIRASLTAVPKRLPVLWAKVSVFSGVVGLFSIVSTFAVFFIGQAFLSGKDLSVSITSEHALRMVIGGAVYLVLVGLIGMALGCVLRNTAAAISTLVALFFVIPPILDLLPSSWSDSIAPYLPANAGEAFWGSPMGTHLSAWTGLLVLIGWTAVALAAAAARLKSRDA